MKTRLLVAFALVVCSVPTQMFGACATHFTNRSDFTWSISGFNGSRSSLLISPNTMVEIPWGDATKIMVSGLIPNRPYTKQFRVQAQEGCYVILFDSNPGFVAFNKPLAGDIVTCAGGC